VTAQEDARSLEWLLVGQRALRARFDDFARALRRNDATALDVALNDFEEHLIRWTQAEEQALLPAVVRAEIPGRDPRRELRLEFIQIRELTRFLVRQRADHIRLHDLIGYLENLDRRLTAHERDMAKVYYPAAAGTLAEGEWTILESARPNA
jgi:tRNA splicing ligase